MFTSFCDILLVKHKSWDEFFTPLWNTDEVDSISIRAPDNFMTGGIEGYPKLIFLISRQKHMF